MAGWWDNEESMNMKSILGNIKGVKENQFVGENTGNGLNRMKGLKERLSRVWGNQGRSGDRALTKQLILGQKRRENYLVSSRKRK